MILWLLLLIVMLGTVVFRYNRRRIYKLASFIPAPVDELPMIGIAHKFTGNTEDIMNSLKQCSYESNKNNGILRGWLGHILYIVLTNPVDLEVVMKTCLEKDDLHRFIRKVIGNGGIFAPDYLVTNSQTTKRIYNIDIDDKSPNRPPTRSGSRDRLCPKSSSGLLGRSVLCSVPIWRRRRKILVPAFSPKVVETFVDVFSEQSEVLVKRLTANVGRKFSAWPYLSTYTLDSVCETAMGVKINAQGDKNSPFLAAMSQMLNLVCERIFHLWLQPDWLYKLFPKYTEHEKNLKVMHDFTDEVIQQKRKEIADNKNNKTKVDDNFDLSAYKRKSFLDLLIALSGGESGYTNIELREEVLTLTIAGTDTSAVAVGYTLKLLGKYPDIQDKVYQELCEVFGDSDRPLVKADLLKLKYLERVVKESLRLFPPVPFIIRKVLEDIKLPSSGYIVPAGSGIVCSIWGVHRDPKYWGPKVECFDPDRFLPEQFKLNHPCSYIPFSNGPRNCLGYQYALMSIKTVLSATLRRFKVAMVAENGPVPQIRVKLDIMMKAVDGYELALERRTPEMNVSHGQ